MSNSGIDEFQHADDVTLYEGMAICAKLGRLVAVHAENDALTARSAGPTARDFMDSRPLIAELEAISRAIAFAEDTGCALHIVHVSSGRGVALVTEARLQRRRRDVRDVPALPLPDAGRRGAARRGREVRAAGSRAHPVCGSGWTRSTWSRPTTRRAARTSSRARFGDAWGGIAGCQTTLTAAGRRVRAAGARAPHVHRRRRALQHAAQGPDRARRRRRSRARRPERRRTRCKREDLLYRHQISPWIGRRLRARVVRTLLRGSDPAPGAGRLLTPATERIPVT